MTVAIVAVAVVWIVGRACWFYGPGLLARHPDHLRLSDRELEQLRRRTERRRQDDL